MPTKQWKRTVATGLLVAGPGAVFAQTPAPPPVFIPGPVPPVVAHPPVTPPGPAGYPTQFGHVVLAGPVPGPAVITPVPSCGVGRPSARARWTYKLEDCLLGRPEGFAAPPLGMSVSLHYEAHVANGVAARMAVYDYDFIRGTDQLNVRGKDRVRQLAALLRLNQFPVVVERMPHSPGLAEARRQAVLAELEAVLPRVPAERVVVGAPTAVPLQGVEAELIYQNLLLQTGSAGTLPGTGAGPGTATSTPGGGGSPTGADPGR